MRPHGTVIAIVGPTASGKTPLGMMVAERIGGEIVSADSRQIYRLMDVGTAKPGREDRERVHHHLIDIRDPGEDYSAGDFMRDGRAAIRDIRLRGKIPILVGGSGLYLRAVIDGLFESPGRNPELRRVLEDRLNRQGAEALLEELRTVDLVSAGRCDPSKPRRILRALEVYHTSGRPMSRLQEEHAAPADFETRQYAPAWERSLLYGMIDERVDRMMQSGLLEEVRGLLAKGFGVQNNALNTVGYSELLAHLGGSLSLSEAVELIKRNTRRFAKRQMTWFRKDPRIEWLPVAGVRDLERLADRIVTAWRPIPPSASV